MDYLIRLETKKDYRETENVTREAFWDVYKPGCNEHLILHKMRNVDAFVKELDFVACDKNKILGNIIYSRAKVINWENTAFEVLCLGPVCVLPEYQGKGIGSFLINQSMQRARQLQYKGIFLIGNPDYYSRFGFRNAMTLNVQTSAGGNFDYFMGLELNKDSMKGISGRFFEDRVFHVSNDELEIFEKQFPKKEKHVTDTQLK
jgi:predicted N-acetyltransferase YhbS